MNKRSLIIILILLAVMALTGTASIAEAQSSNAQWYVSFWNNTELQGDPVYQMSEGNIDHNWGTGSPAPGVQADHWSAQWTAYVNFSAGTYRFRVTSDDGTRIYLGNKHILVDWNKHPAVTKEVLVSLNGGTYPMAVDYFDDVGNAQIKVTWERIGNPVANAADVTIVSSGQVTPPTQSGAWRGEYFNNISLTGTPALVRDEQAINFNWGSGSPSNLVAADYFSARWTTSVNFSAGRYRFTATSDDGVRVWVNNQLIIDRWYDHQAQSFSSEIDLPTGLLPIRIEYYERTGEAVMQFSWTTISTVPQPTPGPTAGIGTVVSARLNVRTGPGTHYPVIHVLSYGQTVNLAGYRSADANWVVIHWNGSTAWVSGRPAYLYTTANIATMPVWTGGVPDTGGPGSGSGPTATVTNCYYLNVRTGPGTSYPVIKAVPAGTVVTLLGRNSTASWAKVQLADGTTGWMGAGYLTSSIPISALPIAG
jgi:uncharacterized protein YraI